MQNVSIEKYFQINQFLEEKKMIFLKIFFSVWLVPKKIIDGVFTVDEILVVMARIRQH
jgi:hypothetical protein